MISRRTAFLFAVLVIALAAIPSQVAAERGGSMPLQDGMLTEDLPLSCEEADFQRQFKKDDKDKKKKDKDKHKKDKDKKVGT